MVCFLPLALREWRGGGLLGVGVELWGKLMLANLSNTKPVKFTTKKCKFMAFEVKNIMLQVIECVIFRKVCKF